MKNIEVHEPRFTINVKRGDEILVENNVMQKITQNSLYKIRKTHTQNKMGKKTCGVEDGMTLLSVGTGITGITGTMGGQGAPASVD